MQKHQDRPSPLSLVGTVLLLVGGPVVYFQRAHDGGRWDVVLPVLLFLIGVWRLLGHVRALM